MALPYLVARRLFAFSRSLTLPLLLLNASQGVLLFIQGSLSCSVGDVRHVMLGILSLLLGILVVIQEFVHLAALRMYAAFLFSFFGRGLLYVALGCVTLEGAGRKAELGIGLVIVAVGVVFVGVAVGSRVEFDDPEDEYAAVVRGMQQGCYGGEAAEKSVRTVDAYSGPQGRSGTLGALTSSSMASASAATDGRGFTSAHLPISNPL